MLKLAYQVGVKLALDADPAGAQLAAAQKMYGIGGGLLGAGGGGLLGHSLGSHFAESSNVDLDTARMVGAGLGALLGGVLGHGVGTSAATMTHGAPQAPPQTPPPPPEAEPEAEPEGPLAGLSPDYAFDPGLGLVDYMPAASQSGMGFSPAYEQAPQYPYTGPEQGYGMGFEPEYGTNQMAFEPGWY